jgi:hypothetical protein
MQRYADTVAKSFASPVMRAALFRNSAPLRRGSIDVSRNLWPGSRHAGPCQRVPSVERMAGRHIHGGRLSFPFGDALTTLHEPKVPSNLARSFQPRNAPVAQSWGRSSVTGWRWFTLSPAGSLFSHEVHISPSRLIRAWVNDAR